MVRQMHTNIAQGTRLRMSNTGRYWRRSVMIYPVLRAVSHCCRSLRRSLGLPTGGLNPLRTFSFYKIRTSRSQCAHRLTVCGIGTFQGRCARMSIALGISLALMAVTRASLPLRRSRAGRVWSFCKFLLHLGYALAYSAVDV